MSNQDSTQQPRARKRVYQIPKEYKDASRLLYWAFVYVRRGASTDKYKITLAGNAKASIRNRITRMCKLAGCECTGRTRDDFETAIKTARRRAEEEGFDPAPVYAHARHIGERLNGPRPKPGERSRRRRPSRGE